MESMAPESAHWRAMAAGAPLFGIKSALAYRAAHPRRARSFHVCYFSVFYFKRDLFPPTDASDAHPANPTSAFSFSGDIKVCSGSDVSSGPERLVAMITSAHTARVHQDSMAKERTPFFCISISLCSTCVRASQVRAVDGAEIVPSGGMLASEANGKESATVKKRPAILLDALGRLGRI